MNTSLKRLVLGVLTLTFFTLTLAACGGGGGSAPANTPTPIVVDAKPGGLWVGQTTNDAQPGIVQDFFGVTTDSGEFRFLSLDTLGQFIGTLTVDGNNVTGTGLGWAPIGFTWTDGSVITSVNISATVTERQQFSGSWSTGTGESGTLTFSYSNFHQRSSTFAKLSANWFFTDGFFSITISVDGSGIITGSDTDGCVYAGQATIPDSNFNTYSLSFDLTSCGAFNGLYSGLAVMDDDVVQDDTLIVTVDNGSVAIILPMSR